MLLCEWDSERGPYIPRESTVLALFRGGRLVYRSADRIRRKYGLRIIVQTHEATDAGSSTSWPLDVEAK